MTWSTPWAWAGLALLALPVLIHLLHRAPATRRQFPSLRFIDESRLPPRRRRRLHDLPLLLVRTAILAAAVTALAGPTLRAGARGATSTRITRAIVLDTSGSMRRTLRGSTTTAIDSAAHIVAALSNSGVTAMTIASASPRQAIGGAIAWLATQAGSREVVVISDFQRGALEAGNVASIPREYGVRLVALEAEPLGREYEEAALFPAASVRVRLPRDGRPDSSTVASEFAWQPARSANSASDGAPALAQPLDTRAALAYNQYDVRIEVGDGERDVVASIATATIGGAMAERFTGRDGAIATVNPSAHRVRAIYVSHADYAARLAEARVPNAGASAWAVELLLRLPQGESFGEAARSTSALPVTARSDSLLVIARSASGDPLLSAGMLDRDSSLALFVRADASSLFSAALITALDRASMPLRDYADRDPVEIPRRELAEWNRAPLDSLTESAVVARVDNDQSVSVARWLWLAALVLLGLETMMRRRLDAARIPAAAP